MPLSEISVDDVQPLYGPVAGGTRVTITGQHINQYTVRAVKIGEYYLKQVLADRLVLIFK